MDWEGYKARCDSPDVWSRWMFVQMLELLSEHADLVAALRSALEGKPLAKPPGHKGGPATDMFELSLTGEQVEAAVAAVRRAVERSEETTGTQGRGLGGFLEAWLEYQCFVVAHERRSQTG